MNNENLDHKCIYCQRKLRVFNVYLDWNSRTLHKSCYKKIENTLDDYDLKLIATEEGLDHYSLKK